jgi:hypothetical protein
MPDRIRDHSMRLNISTQIMALIVLMAVTLTGFALYSITSLISIGEQIHRVARFDAPISQVVARMVEHQLEREIQLRAAIAEIACLTSAFVGRIEGCS